MRQERRIFFWILEINLLSVFLFAPPTRWASRFSSALASGFGFSDDSCKNTERQTSHQLITQTRKTTKKLWQQQETLKDITCDNSQHFATPSPRNDVWEKCAEKNILMTRHHPDLGCSCWLVEANFNQSGNFGCFLRLWKKWLSVSSLHLFRRVDCHLDIQQIFFSKVFNSPNHNKSWRQRHLRSDLKKYRCGLSLNHFFS